MFRRIFALFVAIAFVLLSQNAAPAQQATPVVTFTTVPKNLQLYPRDLTTNRAVVAIQGRVETTGQDEAILRVYRNNSLHTTLNQPLSYGEEGAPFAFAPEIVAELANYDFKLYVRQGQSEALAREVNSVVAGDAYLINGQSNAQAKRWPGSIDTKSLQDNFVRSFGRRDTNASLVLADLNWYRAEGDAYSGPGAVGQWGLHLGRRLRDTHQIPIALISQAHGGQGINFFARNDSNPGDTTTNYGLLLYKAQHAGVTQGVRAMFWYQGEADGGRASTHESGMIGLFSDWQEDYSRLEKIYIHQIRDSTCGIFNMDLLDRQRRLERFDKVEVMSTTGLDGHDGCHFTYSDGYELVGEHLFRVVSRDLYGSGNSANIEPPTSTTPISVAPLKSC